MVDGDQDLAGNAPLWGRRALSVWAKSQVKRGEWLSLPQHLSDSISVVRALFDDWVAPAVRRSWAQALPDGENDALRLVSFLSGSHDVGKASPAFLVQVAGLCEPMRRIGLPIPPVIPQAERRSVPHSLVSQLALEPWLRARGVNAHLAGQLASVAGSHHGQAPTGGSLGEARKRSDLAGEGVWAELRDEILDVVSQLCGTDDRWPAWADMELSVPHLVQMTGLVIVADWIASADDYFPLVALGSPQSCLTPERQGERFNRGWAEVTMPPSWSPIVPTLESSALYADRFDWPDERQARPIQQLAERLARETPPGLMIVEAPMGEGKTELALVVAEIWGARWGASGVYFALPSQATSDAILVRLARWIDRLPGPPASGPPWGLSLMHGRSRLNPDFADMAPDPSCLQTNDESEPSDEQGVDGVNFIAHQWFRGRKRTMLATFGVGTIDQVLFAGLQAKHLMLRHLGLTGKIVIVDEAHASDAFMNVYLDRVLEWLGAYGVPVIVLSATLPGRRRAELLNAYAGPAPPATPRSGLARLNRATAEPARVDRFEQQRADLGYPVITTLARDAEAAVVHRKGPAPDRPPARIAVTEMVGFDDAIAADLRQLLAGGGCALVMRNTVRAAQATARALRAADLGPVTLCHSRFLAADRLSKDRALLDRFGPEGARPERHIVVATQVVEQSLDVDFDVLFSDVPPADLLCQRLGRVHRHRRLRPDRVADPRCFLLLEDPAADPPAMDRGSESIYQRAPLLRCLGALREIGHVLQVPAGVAAFVQRAYGEDPPGPPEWSDVVRAADEQVASLRAKQVGKAETYRLGPVPDASSHASMVGWMERSVGEADPQSKVGRASVRDGEDTLEVIVAPLDAVTGEVIVPPWRTIERRPISVRGVPDDEDARLIVSCAIKLPLSVVPTKMSEVIAELTQDKAVAKWSWHKHPWLKGELILPMRQTAPESHELSARLRDQTLRYTPEYGLEVNQ